MYVCVCVDADVNQGILEGHTDSVWNLVVHPSSGLLLSSSADGICRLWDPLQSSHKLRDFTAPEGCAH